jgi:hypothetical protein
MTAAKILERDFPAPFFARALPLLGDDAVGPLHKADEDGRIAELESPLSDISFRDPTGPAAGASSEDRDFVRDNFLERFLEGRPADGDDCVGRGLAHQRGGFAEEENLHIVTGVG